MDLAADCVAEVARWEPEPGDTPETGPAPNAFANYFSPAAPAQIGEPSGEAEEILGDSLVDQIAADDLQTNTANGLAAPTPHADRSSRRDPVTGAPAWEPPGACY